MKNKLQREFEERDEGIQVRLNKYLSESGVCSRREADRFIEDGRVMVDGKTAVTGMKIFPEQEILVDGKCLRQEREMILLAFYKPVGIVCTTDKRWGDRTVEDVLEYPKRVFNVGRLDKDSEGLLLMTNNGDILNKIMRAGNYHEKEYEVTVDKPVTGEFMKQMAAGGIPVMDTVTRSCRVVKMGKNKMRIVLTQGLNRQIRRMCEYFGYKVIRLKRVRIMNIYLGNLNPGAYRNLTDGEMEELYELLRDSSKESVNKNKVGGSGQKSRQRSE